MRLSGFGDTTVGGDPEAFLVHPRRRIPVPAHSRGLPYKQMPVRLLDGDVLRDGYALELNPQFDECRHMLVFNFWNLLRQAAKNYLTTERIIAQSAMPIDLSTLEDAPEDVSEFGCEGAWNAYDGTVHKPEIHGPTHELRYTGGHFHLAHVKGSSVSWAKNFDNVFLWAKITDRYVGQIETFLVGSEWAGLRRKYYGQAGEFRVQDHPNTVAALEYRTLGSEAWSHPALTVFLLGLARHVYQYFPNFAKVYDPTYEKQVQGIINTGLSHDDNLDLIPELKGWYTRKLLKKARTFFRKGMHKDLIPNILKYSSNACAGKAWGEWCASVGYTHYRNLDDYALSEDVVLAEEASNNSKWGETA